MTTEEDAQGMANVEEGVVTPETVGIPPGTVDVEPGTAGEPPAIVGIAPATPGLTRTGKPSGPAFTRMHHDDMDSEEFEAREGREDEDLG
jgi:hypothetical protein